MEKTQSDGLTLCLMGRIVGEWRGERGWSSVLDIKLEEAECHGDTRTAKAIGPTL